MEAVTLITVPGCDVICNVITVSDSHFIYNKGVVSVSFTKSGPQCVVDNSCGLSVDMLVRLLTALFDENTIAG